MIEIKMGFEIDEAIINDNRYYSREDFSKVRLFLQPGFNPFTAMELGNLTRISYKDYEIFEDGKISPSNQLKPGSYIYAENSNKQRIDRYYILSRDEIADYKDKPNLYEVLDIFHYTSYNFTKIIPEIYRPNLSRFGFIAKRGNQIFVVFRGTREGEEWFNNSQPHQINFFQCQPKFDHTLFADPGSYDVKTSDIRVHWGFHKIYSDYRPGPFLKYPILNAIFSSPGKLYIWLTDKFAGRNASNKHLSMWSVVEEVFNKYYSPGDEVFVSGHSLGGALATLATLHIGYLKNCQPVMYTFASPRVGNSGFAKYFKHKVSRAFRIANTEDIVPNLGSAAIKVAGLEMAYISPEEKKKSSPQRLARKIRRTKQWHKFMNWITDGLYEEGYEHVGKPVVFTFQTRRISSNHNMNAVYCGVIENEVKA